MERALRSHTIRVDGAETHYLECGEQGAERVVLIHDGAFGADSAVTWNPIMQMLGERYHVFAPDQLGFGRTRKIYDFAQGARSQKVNHLAQWMKELSIDRAHVVGNSNGGSLVLFAAMRAAWPIGKAVSIAGTGGPFMTAANYEPLRKYVPDKNAMRAIVELLVARRDEAMERLVEARYRNSLIRGHWESLSAPRLRPPGSQRHDSGNASSEFFDSLAKIDVPVMLIAGSDDPLLDKGWEAQLAKHIKQAKTFIVEGGRHQPHLDEPEKVVAALDAFFRE
jgi:pimeloyl-ACP methyl ester carboxylesterase